MLTKTTLATAGFLPVSRCRSLNKALLLCA